MLTVCLSFGLVLSVQAGVQGTMNVPDSVYLFSYASANGVGGLRFAWSGDGQQWMSVAQDYTYLNSDFGPWGSGKKMFSPMLVQSREDNRWHCLWLTTQSGQVMAHAASDDLLTWDPQAYFYPKDRGQYQPAQAWPVSEQTVTLNRQSLRGWVQRVPYDVVERLSRHADHKRYRQQLYDERAEQDGVRFAGLKPVEAMVRIHPSQGKAISEHLMGIFFEDINYGADGGLYAELVQNRDFEYSAADRREWTPTTAWTLHQNGQEATLEVGTDQPLHANNPHYAVLQASAEGTSVLRNGGWDGIALKQGERYDFSLFGRVPAGSRGGKLKVQLLDKEGREVAATTVSVSSAQWKKRTATLVPDVTVSDAVLAITPQAAGTYHLDMISLFPRNTFKGRKNGLRADLAQTLVDLKPRFVRFPGGCVAHGNGLDNIYDWKGSIGPLEARKPMFNLWGYHQTRGLGYFEYFQFCEDIGAEPVPVVAAGVPCQNSGVPGHRSKDELTTMGQQRGLPMSEMPAYVQDVLDLIEYANGDAKKTEWGRKRAEAGHPKPFNLKYIGIGNEDLITEVFEERFTMIYNAVREKYPEVTVIGTVGPFYEGSDYDAGWKLADKLDIPMVDEHYYVSPGWLIYNQDYYDRYDRNKSKVYLGEYAAHLPGRPNNIETALAEALYLTAVERNADVVTMTSYAPLLAKEHHTQWNPDMIYFNNTEVKPTVGYYAQQMYGQNSGTRYLPSTLTLDNQWDKVRNRVAVSAVLDEATGDYIIKLVNLLPVEVKTKFNLEGVQFSNPVATKTVLSGHPADTKAKPVISDFSVEAQGDTPYLMPAYSFTVIRIHQPAADED